MAVSFRSTASFPLNPPLLPHCPRRRGAQDHHHWLRGPGVPAGSGGRAGTAGSIPPQHPGGGALVRVHTAHTAGGAQIGRGGTAWSPRLLRWYRSSIITPFWSWCLPLWLLFWEHHFHFRENVNQLRDPFETRVLCGPSSVAKFWRDAGPLRKPESERKRTSRADPVAQHIRPKETRVFRSRGVRWLTQNFL